MTAPFNPLAGNFSTTGWLADVDDYNLKIVKVEYKMIGNESPKPVLQFTLAVADGPYVNKRPQQLTVWEPETDFSTAGRIIMAAKGFNPGKQDGEFAQQYSSADFTLDSTNPEALTMGNDYKELEGAVFTATLGQNVSKKDGKTYQTYKNIRPIGN